MQLQAAEWPVAKGREAETASGVRVSQRAWHLVWIACVCIGYEVQFLYQPPNPVDEGWLLYAAKRLHEGGTLYADTFFVFPPGHLLAAWIGYAVAPPGVEAARVLYGGFNLALCLALYLLARHLVAPHLALLAAMLVALASFQSHMQHSVFGFRYLVWSIFGLLAFARSCEGGGRRWLFAAGIAGGVATVFRLTPGFAVSVAIGLATLARPGGPTRWFRDWGAYLLGLFAVLAGAIGWAMSGVDAATLWREIVVRPVVMTDLQSFPLPPLWPAGAEGRDRATAIFVALQFRLIPLLLLAYGATLGLALWRTWRTGDPFGKPLLLAIWLFALIYFTRTFGRSDEPHLASALPPICLLLAHALGSVWPRLQEPRAGMRAVAALTIVWMFAWGSDRAFAPLARDLFGENKGDATSWLDRRASLRSMQRAARERIDSGGSPRVVLDLSSRPIIFTTGEFTGPGWFDIVMPGTFMTSEEERSFVERLSADPPAGVYWPVEPFDRMDERSTAATAPLLTEWARRTYGPPPPR